MKKRTIALTLAMLTMVSAVGCGKSESGNTAKGGNESASGPVEIEFWYGLGGTLGETMEEMIVAFNESQDEVVVKGVVQSSYEETSKMLQAAIASWRGSGLLFGQSHRLHYVCGKRCIGIYG